ncbi:MAG: hypothetical protein CSB34_04245 [Desulfobulbus propionicus]|nr:MAG: hypothetical protein CSB34_04245 [Desulfobulbus propionicus]PIE66370.1 MAG: hypothetical protein CSA26_01065 [Desulfobacterales bacterium]
MNTLIDPITVSQIQQHADPTQAKGINPKDQQAMQEASKDFEAVFIQSLLKEMRKSVPENTLFPKSNAQKMYEEMQDAELARHMAKYQSLGLAQQVYQQLEKYHTPSKK